MPSIENLRRRRTRWDDDLPEKIIFHLATRSNLLELDISARWTKALVLQLEREVARPFRALEVFRCLVWSEVASQLLSHLPTLKQLDLDVVDSEIPDGRLHDNAFFHSISRMPRLTELDVSPVRNSIFHPEPFLQMAEKCSQLRRLRINCDWHFITILEIRDAHIEAVTLALPALEEFIWKAFKLNVTVQSLRHLGKNCRRLRDCRLGVHEIDLMELDVSEPPLFPNLGVLSLQSFASHDGRLAVAALHHHAPLIRALGVKHRAHSKYHYWVYRSEFQKFGHDEKIESLFGLNSVGAGHL